MLSCPCLVCPGTAGRQKNTAAKERCRHGVEPAQMSLRVLQVEGPWGLDVQASWISHHVTNLVQSCVQAIGFNVCPLIPSLALIRPFKLPFL